MEDRALHTAWKSRVGTGAAACLVMRGVGSCWFEGTVCSVAHLSCGVLVYATGMDGAIPWKPAYPFPLARVVGPTRKEQARGGICHE